MFKAGQEVIVKTPEEIMKTEKLEYCGYGYTGENNSIYTEKMKSLAGQIIVITKVYKDDEQYQYCTGRWYWREAWLKPVKRINK